MLDRFNTKHKGESLVEVVVALGILAFMFMGVTNIIVGSITLNLSARERLETVAKVQKIMNEWLADNRPDNSCPVTARPLQLSPAISVDYVGDGVGPDCNTETLDTPGEGCYWLELSALDSTEKLLNGQSDANFIKLTSHGKWFVRILGEQSFEASQIIRKQ